MVFRTAAPGEEEAVFRFYQSIPTKTEKDYKLWWSLDVYPTRKDFSGAVGNNTMHLALEGKSSSGQNGRRELPSRRK